MERSVALADAKSSTNGLDSVLIAAALLGSRRRASQKSDGGGEGTAPPNVLLGEEERRLDHGVSSTPRTRSPRLHRCKSLSRHGTRNDDALRGIHAMHLDLPLCQIHTHSCNLVHGLPLSKVQIDFRKNQSWHSDAVSSIAGSPFVFVRDRQATARRRETPVEIIRHAAPWRCVRLTFTSAISSDPKE
jgi:hypothetical protein